MLHECLYVSWLGQYLKDIMVTSMLYEIPSGIGPYILHAEDKWDLRKKKWKDDWKIEAYHHAVQITSSVFFNWFPFWESVIGEYSPWPIFPVCPLVISFSSLLFTSQAVLSFISFVAVSESPLIWVAQYQFIIFPILLSLIYCLDLCSDYSDLWQQILKNCHPRISTCI